MGRRVAVALLAVLLLTTPVAAAQPGPDRPDFPLAPVVLGAIAGVVLAAFTWPTVQPIAFVLFGSLDPFEIELLRYTGTPYLLTGAMLGAAAGAASTR